MKYMEQGTPEWYDERAGHVTASRIKDVLIKKSDSKVRDAYMAQLISERLTHRSKEEDRGTYFDIQRGKHLEPKARVEYEFRHNVTVTSVGFFKHPRLPWFGCSPDGEIGDDGLIQIKAPRLHIFMDWRINGIVPPDHKDQMLAELSCRPERKWNDFCGYVDDDDLPEHLQMFVVRLARDEPRIAEIEAAVAKFNAELEEKMLRLQASDLSIEEKLKVTLKSVVGESVTETA